jgi:hypothetical protein
LTNDRGEYRLYGVPPGQYLLAATVPGGKAPGLAATFYPGTLNGTEALTVDVTSGGDVSGVDFALLPMTGSRVSGALVDAAGNPTMGGRFNLVLRAGLATAFGAWIEPDGQFEFRDVPPGQYIIQADRGRATPAVEGEFGAFAVSVGPDGIRNLHLQTSTGSRIAGKVTFESLTGRRAPAPGSVEVSPIPVDYDLAPASVATTSPKRDGTFEMRGINGERRLQVTRMPAGWTLKSILSNGSDVTDEALTFGRAEQSLADVEIVLTDRVTEIRGRVADDRGRTVTGAQVIIASADRGRWYPESRFVASRVIDGNGSFSITGLPPGSYFVAAVPRLPGGEAWRDPALLETIRADGTLVSLGEGQQQIVSLRVASSR